MRDLMERVKNMSLPERLDLMNCRGVLNAREQLRNTYRSRDKLLMSAGTCQRQDDEHGPNLGQRLPIVVRGS